MMETAGIDRDRLQVRITAFYARETTLLDDGNYKAWLELLDEDVRYTMPLQELRQGPPSEADESLPPFYLFNDDKSTLRTRIARLDTGLALTDHPPALTQRLVTDVFIVSASDGFAEVRSSFMVYEVRDEANDSFFVGRRLDTLRCDGDAFTVLKRHITLAQFVLPRSIAIFF